MSQRFSLLRKLVTHYFPAILYGLCTRCAAYKHSPTKQPILATGIRIELVDRSGSRLKAGSF